MAKRELNYSLKIDFLTKTILIYRPSRLLIDKNDIRRDVDVGSTADLVLVFFIHLVHLVHLLHLVHLILMVLVELLYSWYSWNSWYSFTLGTRCTCGTAAHRANSAQNWKQPICTY